MKSLPLFCKYYGLIDDASGQITGLYISKKIGIKVFYNNELYTVKPISDKDNIPIEKLESIV